MQRAALLDHAAQRLVHTGQSTKQVDMDTCFSLRHHSELRALGNGHEIAGHSLQHTSQSLAQSCLLIGGSGACHTPNQQLISGDFQQHFTAMTDWGRRNDWRSEVDSAVSRTAEWVSPEAQNLRSW